MPPAPITRQSKTESLLLAASARGQPALGHPLEAVVADDCQYRLGSEPADTSKRLLWLWFRRGVPAAEQPQTPAPAAALTWAIPPVGVCTQAPANIECFVLGPP